MLSKEVIHSLIDPDVQVFVYDTVTSTNDVAKNLCKSCDGRILIVADGQTNGRGRQGKSFFSPHESGLYFSLAVDANSPAFEFAGITCAVAVACSRAIEKLTKLETKIKWVNDICIEDKKVCGILVQSVSEGAIVKKLIIGVGINVSTSSFPEDIKEIAGSLKKNIDRNILAAEIVNNISELLFAKPDKYIDEYRRKSNVIGKEITFLKNGVAHPARAVDIDENGGLIVETNGEKLTLTSGEISIRLR